jgi:hypothetical protein
MSKNKESDKKKSSKESSSKESQKESSKKSKEIKKEEDEDEENKPCNKNTGKAGLKFDVNTRKTWMKKFYERTDCTVNDDKNEKEYPSISKSQYTLAACEEVLCAHLAKLAWDKTEKTKKNGMIELSEETFKDVISSNEELRIILGPYLAGYKSQEGYFENLKIKENELTSYVEKYAVSGGNSNIHLTSSGMNFLCYLLQTNRSMLCTCAYHMTVFKGGKQINEKALTASVKNHYGQVKNLCKMITDKFDEVISKIDDANEAERDAKGEKEKKEKKENKDKKKGKKVDKKNDSDEDESSDEESD